MSDYDRELYEILTSDSELGQKLNQKLFGDNEFSEVDRSNYLDRLRDNMISDSFSGGA